jgi:outer membrane protein TolC
MDKNYIERNGNVAPGSMARLDRGTVFLGAVLCLGLALAPGLTGGLLAQGPGGPPQTAAQQPAAQSDNSITPSQAALSQATGSNGSAVTSQSFKGSLVEGRNTGTVIDLSLDDAVARGLRQNLGLILQGSAVRAANGQRLEQLQQLLPTISAGASVEVEQINLAAFGFKFPGLKPVVGPFQVVDFRAYLTQSLFNLNSLETYIASRHNFAAQQLTAEDARDMVVLTVGNAYLVCVADAARITAVEAELKTSKLTLDQAVASHDAGISPRLDVLRAQVDYQTEQQTLISTTNQLAKDRIALARVIGLPLDQKFALTDTAPYKALDNLDADAAFAAALKVRKDLQASAEQVRAAEAAKKAVLADRLPTASFSGDYGDIGTTPGHSHGTFTATGSVTAPLLQVDKNRGERQTADASLHQAQDRMADQAQQINADIRASILDIQSAAKLVDASKSNVDLAGEALAEAQQRFHAGVADTLPVSQAQTQFEQANDQYISALYQHNVAKLQLARALGVAQTNYKDYLGGK